MIPGPRRACDILSEMIAIDAPPEDLLDWLIRIVASRGWPISEPTVQEQAAIWLDKFQIYLRRELSELNRLGRFAVFTFNTSSEYKIQGVAFIEPHDAEEVRRQKRKRSQYAAYANQLRSLTPRQLEQLCVGILTLIRVDSPSITRYSADRGVDFYGRLLLESYIFSEDVYPSWKRQLKVWIVGQAKHYVDGTISTGVIRELVGSVTLIGGPTANLKPFPNLVIRACDPVFRMIVTTGRLSSDSWSLVDESGVVAMDGAMVAAFLSDRGIGYSDEGFNAGDFLTWLGTFANQPVQAVLDDVDEFD